MSTTRTTSAASRPRRGGLGPGAGRAIAGSAIGSPRSPLPWSPEAVRTDQRAELERHRQAVERWAKEFEGLDEDVFAEAAQEARDDGQDAAAAVDRLVRLLFGHLAEWDRAQQRLEAGLRELGHGRALAQWAREAVAAEEGRVCGARCWSRWSVIITTGPSNLGERSLTNALSCGNAVTLMARQGIPGRPSRCPGEASKVSLGNLGEGRGAHLGELGRPGRSPWRRPRHHHQAVGEVATLMPHQGTGREHQGVRGDHQGAPCSRGAAAPCCTGCSGAARTGVALSVSVSVEASCR